MLSRCLPTLLTLFLAGAVGSQPARADIYTWVDAAGTINLSNVAPPESVHVTNVLRASAKPAAAREAARQAEVQALEDRVRQLESEAESARRQPTPQMEYRAAQSPPPIQYVAIPSPAPAPYAAATVPSPNYGCDPTQIECWLWAPGAYPTGVVLIPATRFRPFHPSHRGHPFSVRQPMHVGGVFRSR